MFVEVERFSKGASHVLYPRTIVRWESPDEREFREEERQEIVADFKRYFEINKISYDIE